MFTIALDVSRGSHRTGRCAVIWLWAAGNVYHGGNLLSLLTFFAWPFLHNRPGWAGTAGSGDGGRASPDLSTGCAGGSGFTCYQVMVTAAVQCEHPSCLVPLLLWCFSFIQVTYRQISRGLSEEQTCQGNGWRERVRGGDGDVTLVLITNESLQTALTGKWLYF